MEKGGYCEGMRKTITLCQTVTAAGKFYYVDGKRVTFEAFLTAKFQRRQDNFITRVSKHAVKNLSTIYL